MNPHFASTVDAIPDYSKECQVLKNKPIIVNLADSLSDLLSNIEKYVKMRQTGKTFVYKMLRAFVDKEMYSLSAKLLGIRMQGDTIYFDNEEETSYQVNFLLYDYKVNRKNVVQKYQESNITKTKIENELLASMLSSYTSLFEVTSIRGFKVGLKDLFRIEDKPLQLIDIALQRNRNPWNVNICQTCPHR